MNGNIFAIRKMIKNKNTMDMDNENITSTPLSERAEEIENEQLAEETKQEESENCENWEEKYNDVNDRYLRLTAEFDNYRKRTIREKADMLKTAGESIFVDMLPVIDDFERGLKAIGETNDITAAKEGIELIYNKFKSFLSQNGVKVIETENQSFDVDLHEAITTIPAPEENLKGKIIDCVSKGYMLNDKVIRFPKVVVSQ